MARTSFKQGIAKRFRILTVLLLVATVFAALGSHHWFAELFSHFTPHYSVFALLCLLGLALLRVWRWAAVACALVLWNGYPVARTLLNSEAPAAATSRQFTVFHFNVGLHHEQPGRITSYLQRRQGNIFGCPVVDRTTTLALPRSSFSAFRRYSKPRRKGHYAHYGNV